MNIRNWHPRAVCPRCEAHFYAPFGKVFFLDFEYCPECGEPKADGYPWRNQHGWPVQPMRWVSHTRLLRPSTWGTGEWQVGS